MGLEPNETAKEPSGTKPRVSLKWELLTLLGFAGLVLGSAVALRLCVAQAYEIRGKSMEPTFHDGDRVVLLKIAPTILPINRDDIVIFSHPSQPDRDLVKRVIAVGGDLLGIHDGEVFVNGRRALLSGPRTGRGRLRNIRIVVPEGSYFVLGDNFSNSLDSRDFGPVTHDLVKGKVWFRWWPIGGHDRDH